MAEDVGPSAEEEPPAAPPEEETPESKARGICLRLLTTRPRTRAQLAEALRRREVPEDVSDSVLGRLSEVGLVDDVAFARVWVDSRHAGRGPSGRALSAELRRRGVADETIRGAVADLDPDSEEETARSLVRRRIGATRGKETAVRVRRLMGVLARKGYGQGLAYRVVREELEAEGAEVGDHEGGEDEPGLSLP